jgi:DNA-binding response OmpR family regulator
VKTILLVEDGRFSRVTNERALVRAGYRMKTACDGDEALRLAVVSVPDLVLLHMLLPKLSGPEVLRSLRSKPKTAQVPIVVLSSVPQSNEASEFLIQIVTRSLDGHARRASDAVFLAQDLPVGTVAGRI